MDDNKRQKLAEINYTILRTCALCLYAKFPNDDWGTCQNNTYLHAKHNGVQQLSINKNGSCPGFIRSSKAIVPMFHFKDFFTF